MAALRFWELAPSPNNLKVRIALSYKGIDFESVPVEPADRVSVKRATGQELTPAIEDRGIALPDSEAILHYLDANYRDTPRLSPAGRAGRGECDTWKRILDERVLKHWLPVFRFAIQRTDHLDEDARQRFQDALAWLDDEIGERGSFKDDPEMAVCDLRVAVWAVYAFPGAGLIARVPLFRRMQEHFGMDPGALPNLERFLRPWNDHLI